MRSWRTSLAGLSESMASSPLRSTPQVLSVLFHPTTSGGVNYCIMPPLHLHIDCLAGPSQPAGKGWHASRGRTPHAC